MTRHVALAALLCLAVAGCGSDGPEDPQDYGNILNSPEGLVLVEEEHQTGWTRPDCFTCHPVQTMHTVNRTGIPDLDLNEIQTLIKNEGLAACVQCHGRNGVEP